MTIDAPGHIHPPASTGGQTPDATPVASVAGLRVRFHTARGSVEAVDGVDFEITAGETVAFVGESGSGKSVTARSLVGLSGATAVTAERFRVFGEEALAYTDQQWRSLRGARIGLIHQDALVSLDPLRTVGKEISEVILTHDPYIRRREAAEQAKGFLRAAGIDDPERRYHEYSLQLSGGLRQRALIAAALAGTPELLIADEPTTALDVTIQKQILQLLRERRELGSTLLLISHDLAVVSELADRIYVFNRGRVVESGSAEQVVTDPRHPYTRRLLRAIPSRTTRGRRLSWVPPHERDAADVDAATGAAPVAADESTAPALLTPRVIDPDRAILRADGLVKTFAVRRFERVTAVQDVSLQVFAGETLGIVGESGSGKSTVARLLLGLSRPTRGTVLLDGEPWSSLDDRGRQARRHLVQFVAQDPLSSFNPHFTVARIVAESLDSTLGPRERAARVHDLLDAVGLARRVLERRPRELSGGERQRVAIARALAPSPAVIVADEPVSALDVSVQAQVLDLFADTQAAFGVSIVFVSHDLGVVHHIADRVLVLRGGRVVEAGPVETVFAEPRHPYTRLLIDSIPGAPSHPG